MARQGAGRRVVPPPPWRPRASSVPGTPDRAGGQSFAEVVQNSSLAVHQAERLCYKLAYIWYMAASRRQAAGAPAAPTTRARRGPPNRGGRHSACSCGPLPARPAALRVSYPGATAQTTAAARRRRGPGRRRPCRSRRPRRRRAAWWARGQSQPARACCLAGAAAQSCARWRSSRRPRAGRPAGGECVRGEGRTVQQLGHLGGLPGAVAPAAGQQLGERSPATAASPSPSGSTHADERQRRQRVAAPRGGRVAALLLLLHRRRRRRRPLLRPALLLPAAAAAAAAVLLPPSRQAEHVGGALVAGHRQPGGRVAAAEGDGVDGCWVGAAAQLPKLAAIGGGEDADLQGRAVEAACAQAGGYGLRCCAGCNRLRGRRIRACNGRSPAWHAPSPARPPRSTWPAAGPQQPLDERSTTAAPASKPQREGPSPACPSRWTWPAACRWRTAPAPPARCCGPPQTWCAACRTAPLAPAVSGHSKGRARA